MSLQTPKRSAEWEVTGVATWSGPKTRPLEWETGAASEAAALGLLLASWAWDGAFSNRSYLAPCFSEEALPEPQRLLNGLGDFSLLFSFLFFKKTKQNYSRGWNAVNPNFPIWSFIKAVLIGPRKVFIKTPHFAENVPAWLPEAGKATDIKFYYFNAPVAARRT